ncbi:MAG: diacylglycerol kinase family protein [Ginsengibacter sp.]
MQTSEPAKILFVINPKSGTKSGIDWESEARQYFKELPHIIEFVLMGDKNDAGSLKYWIETFKPDKVVAVGGDGTVSLVAEQLLRTPIAMGILPAGSANGMATEMQIPSSVKGAMDVLINGNVKCADVVLIDDKHICIHLSDLGLNAQLVKYFQAGNLRGKLGYARLVLRVLLRKRRMHLTIKTDKEEIAAHAYMVVLANASKYGTGALINPEGDLHDGFFEIVIVRRVAFFSVLKMFLQFKKFNSKKVEVFKAKTVDITVTSKAHFQIDGEYIGKVRKVSAKILESQLNLLLPNI